MNLIADNMATYRIEAVEFNDKKQDYEVIFERTRSFDCDEAALAYARATAPKGRKVSIFRMVGGGMNYPPRPPKPATNEAAAA